MIEQLRAEIEFLKEENRQLRLLLKYDALTKARSQADLIEKQKQNVNDTTIVFAFDLKDFGLYNVMHGHNNGDIFLLQFAQILRSIFRDGDTIFRRGGDEFVAILNYKSINIGNILNRLVEIDSIAYVGYVIGTGNINSLVDEAFGEIELIKQEKFK